VGVRQHQRAAYYTEGAKTYGFEIAEQLGWKLPSTSSSVRRRHDPPKVAKAFKELRDLGLVDGDFKIYTAQASGCAPIVSADATKQDAISSPREAEHIAKSIAIGNPADGFTS
jgi:threonine synthase